MQITVCLPFSSAFFACELCNIKFRLFSFCKSNIRKYPYIEYMLEFIFARLVVSFPELELRFPIQLFYYRKEKYLHII